MGRIEKLKRIRKMRIHREGTSILVVSFIVLLLLNSLSWNFVPYEIFNILLSGISLFVYLMMVNFFRSPKRIFPFDDVEKTVVAPADGKIVVLEEVYEPDYFKDNRKMVSIFMSPLNVHANWYPVDGIIKRVSHQNGKFMKAWLPKASVENERSLVLIETPEGTEILVRQIAGAMARRIVTYAEPGDECFIDQHMGFIKFGSRVDLYLPLDADICVELGQKTVGDETIIAKLK